MVPVPLLPDAEAADLGFGCAAMAAAVEPNALACAASQRLCVVAELTGLPTSVFSCVSPVGPML
jgi:hypothetical protein